MKDWIYENVVSHLTWTSLIYGLLMFVVTFVVGTAVAAFVVVKMPADYFHPSYGRDLFAGRHAALRWTGTIVKNVAGAFIVLVGVVMMVAPGPGVLAILLGITLLDFPGKRRLELKLISRPEVLRAVNSIRARFNKPPLALG